MKEVRYFYAPDMLRAGELPEGEAQHACRVLRLTEGSQIVLMDGRGHFAEAEITLATPHHTHYKITHSIDVSKTWQGTINLAIAPTKMMERMEWLAEKATEIGFDSLTLLDCQFSERRTVKADRLERIVVAAMKQSRKPFLPEVRPMQSFRDYIAEQRPGCKYIACCYDEIERQDLFDCLGEEVSECPAQETHILIGPEGDFSIEEVRQAMTEGYIPVSLGQSRLRTETAGLAAVMIANLRQRI